MAVAARAKYWCTATVADCRADGTRPPAPYHYDSPNMPGYAWPSYAAIPNYAAVTYPKQYSPTAWPYIGPFYPYPQVPLGWRKVTLEWKDGWWFLDFKDNPLSLTAELSCACMFLGPGRDAQGSSLGFWVASMQVDLASTHNRATESASTARNPAFSHATEKPASSAQLYTITSHMRCFAPRRVE